jgi:hypothetical protein
MTERWDWFRAIAQRIGLSREQVEAVERAGVPTLVQDPLNRQVHYRVRPDPDWTERMGDAWHGELVNSRRQSAGIVPVRDGRLLIAESSAPEKGVTADMVPGDYEVVLTIAHLGAEESGDYEEHVSHAFALLCGNDGVAAIEPLTDEGGTELGVEAVWMVFAGTGVVERLAAEHVGGRMWAIDDVLAPAMRAADPSGGKSARIATGDGSGALVVVRAGHGREDYPLFRMADPAGRTVGILVDFFVDNRPWPA